VQIHVAFLNFVFLSNYKLYFYEKNHFLYPKGEYLLINLLNKLQDTAQLKFKFYINSIIYYKILKLIIKIFYILHTPG
jgi:hypothetical protein